MKNGLRVGHIQFCVDMGLPANQTAMADHREMNLFVKQVVGTFARHDIPATWATSQPVNSELCDTIVGTDSRHELALLGDDSWLSESISRDRIIEHFTMSMAAAANCGKPLKTLVLRDPAPESLFVVFRKRGVDTVRPIVEKDHGKSQRDPALRMNDMFLAPPTAVFPASGRFLGKFDTGFRGKQILNRARGRHTSEHLAIDASAMMENPTASLRGLERILRFAAKFESQGSIKLETVGEASLRWSPRRATSQRSVLRPAA